MPQYMPQLAVGDSYSGVAQNALSLDAARDSRYFQSLADERARQRAMVDAQLQGRQLDQQREYQQASLAQAFAEKEAEHELALRQMGQQESQFGRNQANELALANIRVKPYEDRLTARDRLNTFQQAYSAINSGSIKTPADLQAFAGDALPAQDLDKLNIFLNEQHKRLLTAFGQQSTAAQNANLDYARRVGVFEPAYDKVQQQMASAPTADTQSHALGWLNPVNWLHPADYAKNFGPTADDLRLSPGYRNYTGALSNFEAANEKNKPLQRSTEYNAATHTFAPLMPAPENWTTPAITPAPVNPPTMPGAIPPMNTTSLGTNQPWQKVPGTGYEIHPNEYANIMSQVNSVPVTDPNRSATQSVMARKLVQDALSRGTARLPGNTGTDDSGSGIDFSVQ